jgi:hypothetical protein
MAENYRFERVSVAATGATPVTLVSAPPEGVSYRIFFVNGRNDAGAARTLWGRINKAGTYYWCFRTATYNGVSFITQLGTFALAEYPTIAVLDDTDETLQVYLNGTGTMTISAFYEIMEQTGEQTIRNALATTNGTTGVELIPAPTSETVHRVLNANGFNGSGGTRNLYLDAGTGSPIERMVQLQSVNNSIFRPLTATNQSPFPPFILSGTSDSCVMSLDNTGTINVCAFYEVLSRRVV